MSTLPLFYRSVVPLDRDLHRAWRLAQPQRFAFARASHLVPALVDEIGPACRHLPVVFMPESAGPVAVFLVGAMPDGCGLLDPDGAWSGRYLPAYLRRYPFILGERDGTDPVVCLDQEADVVLRDEGSRDQHPRDPEAPPSGGTPAPGASLPLFEQDGGETELLKERIRLVSDYAIAARRTAAFGRALQDLKLLHPLTIRTQRPDGESHTLHGILGVDETALAGLPESDLARLHREGWLPAIYAHLISLQAVADFLVTPSTPPNVAPRPAPELDRMDDAA